MVKTLVADPGMASLFQSEIAAHVATLKRGLEVVAAGFGLEETLEELLRAVHSIKGAARIVSVEPASALAVQLEQILNRSLKADTGPEPEALAAIGQAVDALEQLGETLSEEAAAEVSRLTVQLGQWRDGGPGPAAAPEAGQTRHPEEPERSSGLQQAPATSVSISVLSLFQAEAEAHTKTLVDGLLVLEQDPSNSDLLDGLMRAAHSIKGAARIVKLDPAVTLAHQMENLFVSAQEGRLTLEARAIDLVLECTDLLASIGRASHDRSVVTDQTMVDRVDRLVSSLKAVLEGKGPPPAAAPREQQQQQKKKPKREARIEPQVEESVQPSLGAQLEGTDDTVRVAATQLNTLMELTGESLVRGRRIQALDAPFRELRRSLASIEDSIDELSNALEGGADTDCHELLATLRRDLKRSQQQLARQVDAFGAFAVEHDKLTDRIYQEAISTKMRPFADVLQGFPRMIRDICRRLGKQARLDIAGQKVKVDREVLAKIEAPLMHLLRNALDHGLEAPDERSRVGKPEVGRLAVEARHHAGMLVINVSDDGRGIDLESLRRQVVERKLVDPEMGSKLSADELFTFMFLPGFTTAQEITDLSGRGVGLDVVQTMVQEVGGKVQVTSEQGQGTRVTLRLPATLSVIRALLVEIDGEPYACRLSRIERCLRIRHDQAQKEEGRHRIEHDGRRVVLVEATEVLDLSPSSVRQGDLSVVLISEGMETFGLVVDRLIGEHDLVVRPLDPRLGKVKSIAAVAVMETGEPVLLLDVEDLVNSIRAKITGKQTEVATARDRVVVREKRILVVDDSVTVREEERRFLEGYGYLVDSAVDGMDAWGALSLASYDLVITDLDMPRLNGLELLKRIRGSEKHRGLPVIIVSYKDRPEDQRLGLEAGAQYYFTKSSFQDDSMIEAVKQLLAKSGE